MKINQVEIRNFRSIQKLNLSFTDTSIVCGPNSCGKSNVLRALKFAFLSTFSPDKVFINFCTAVTSPNAEILIEIEFDQPTSSLAAALKLPVNKSFIYSLKVKRNSSAKYKINEKKIDSMQRDILLSEIVIVHVPPIRDLAAGGLDLFRTTLAATIRKSRGENSFVKLNKEVREAVRRSGLQILSNTQDAARALLQVEELSIDVSGIEIDALLPLTGINFKVNKVESSLDKLGTGHQSSVILSLYRQLGSITDKFVLFLFEEPDNHLHPTSLRAVADELKLCVSAQSQAVITTHSPYFLNQFLATDWRPLSFDLNRATVARPCDVRDERRLRVGLAKYGLRPPEALLSKQVVVVEGASDVTFVRELIDIHTKCSADRQDILVLSAGGKGQVSDLCLLLDELGANWKGVMDWDSVLDTHQQNLQSGLSVTDVSAIQSAISVLESKQQKHPVKDSYLKKTLDRLRHELQNTNIPFKPDFSNSVLGSHLNASKVLSGSEISRLKKDLKRPSMRSIRAILTKANMWIWSGTPEDILLNSPAAESVVESMLLTKNILKQSPQSANRRTTLINSLKKLSHHPEVLQDIIRELHLTKLLPMRETRDFVKTLIK